MIEGFNLGQLFHYSYMDYGNDGYETLSLGI